MKRMLMIALLALAVGTTVAGPAAADSLPSPMMEEVIVKVSLLTFNDANLTGNYDVMYAKMGKQFREQFSADDLKKGFKSFAGQHIDIIAVKPIVRTSDAKISNGVLMLRGYFDTTPSRLSYELNFGVSEGEWKLIAINVRIKPLSTSDAAGPGVLANVGIDPLALGK